MQKASCTIFLFAVLKGKDIQINKFACEGIYLQNNLNFLHYTNVSLLIASQRCIFFYSYYFSHRKDDSMCIKEWAIIEVQGDLECNTVGGCTVGGKLIGQLLFTSKVIMFGDPNTFHYGSISEMFLVFASFVLF